MLNKLRDSLLQDKNLRFYMCADLTKLADCLNGKCLENVWLEQYSPDSTNRENKAIFGTNQPFNVSQTWNLKKLTPNDSSSARNDCKIFTSSPKRDFVISLGTSDSSYIRLVSSLDVNSFDHPNYAPLLVLIEYFTQTEGPLWEAVRGPGYCYNQSISLSPEFAQIELSLDECCNLPKAYQATRRIFIEHLNNKNEFEDDLLEMAKNSLTYLLIDDLKSVSSFSAYSMSCLFKRVGVDAVSKLFKKIEKVEIRDLKRLLRLYIMPLFDDENSNCLIVCHPSKTDFIIDEFSQNFDRKLNVIGKLDECFCSLVPS